MKLISSPLFKTSNIANQLRFATLLPIIIVTLFFAFFYTSKALEDTKQERMNSAKTYLKQLLPTTEFALAHQTNATLQELVQASTTHPDLKALSIYNVKKELLVYHGTPISLPASVTSITKYPFIKVVKNTVYAAVLAPGTTSPIIGWIGLQLDPHPAQIAYYKHLLVGLLIGSIGFASALLMQIFLTQTIVLPLARLRRSMKQILRNQFETEIYIPPSASLKDIAEGCHYLQKQYLDSVYDLNHQVEVATADLQQSLELLEEKNIELSLDKRKIEEKVLQQSEFIANMSHEIRTPMNGIIGFTNVLLDTQLSTLQKDYINTIKSSAHDLLNIINDILDYSKIDAGKLSLEHIPVDLRYTIDEVITLAAPAANQKQLELIAFTEVTVPKIVMGDSLRIKQILHNLLTNAVKFTEHGHVLIKISVAQELPTHYELSFTVSDTGIGIAPKEKNRLFNAFYQADSTISRRFGGSGLGLVICKKLCETMGGQISVESQLEQGTTFTVTLPLKKLPAYEQEKNTPHTEKAKKILCLDTNPLSLIALEQTLLAINYQPIGLCELSQLPEVVAEHPDIHLTICNLHEPEAFDLNDFLNQHPYPCLVLSRTQLSLDMPVSVLLKPIQTQKLEEKLTTFFNPTQRFHAPSSHLEELRHQLALRSPTLLVAEDNPVNRLLLETILSPYCKIEIVQDGEAAVQACLKKRYELIMLDLQMPKRSGKNVAFYLREQLPAYQHTPILFISANASDMEEHTLDQLRINKCLQKPIDEETLIREILNALNNQTVLSIDWEKCVKNLSGNHELAITCMSQFIDELHQNKMTFKTLIKAKDLKTIGDTAHMLKGACGFLAVSQLKQIAHDIETQSRTHSITQLKPLFKALFEEIERVFEAYKKIQ